MLTKKVTLFNRLLKLSFFYRLKKKVTELDLTGLHYSHLLFNLDKFLCFMFKLIPFFFNIVKNQGGVFFIGIKFILLKWFQKTCKSSQQGVISIWKGGIISNFFRVRVWAEVKSRLALKNLPVVFIFLNFDTYLTAFKEVATVNLPIIGIFEKYINPSFVYSLGELKQTFFINCFFFKLFSQFIKHLS